MSKYGASYPWEWPQDVQDRVKVAQARWTGVLGDIPGSVWSSRLNDRLGDRKPFDLVQESAEGLQLVLAELDRLALVTTPAPPRQPAPRRRRR